MIRKLLPLALLLLLLAVPATASADDEDDARAPLVTRIVDIGALTVGRPWFLRMQPPTVDSWATERDEARPLFGAESEEPILPFGTVDEIIELIKNAVEPRFWEERQGADIRSSGEHRLVVKASIRVLDAVTAFLRRLERQVGQAVTVDVRAVRLSRREALGYREGEFDAALAATLLARSAPWPSASVTTFAGMRSAAFGGRQWAYLADHDVEVAETAQIGDPIVGVANVGLTLDVIAQPVPESGRVLVGLDATLSDLHGHRTVAAGEVGTLDAPAFAVTSARAAVVLQANEWTLLDGAATDGAGGDTAWYFLVRATVHEAPASDARPVVVDLPKWEASDRMPEWDELEVRYYPVPVLSAAVRWESGAAHHLVPSNYQPPEPPELPEPAPIFPEEGLVDLLRETVGGERAWEDPATIEVRNRTIIVRQRPEVHQVTEEWLEVLREAFLRTIYVTGQVIDLPFDVAQVLPAGGALDERGLALLSEALRTGEGERIEVARLTSLAGARNTVVSGRYVTYVSDIEVEIAQEAAIRNPVESRFLDGVQLDVQPRLGIDGHTVSMEVRFHRARPIGPMRTHTLTDGATIELPELEMQRVRTAFSMPLNRPAVVATWNAGDRRRVLLVVAELR